MQQEYFTVALHLGSALAAGSLIGIERTFHGRPAGFRTHALVCVASALLMLVTTYQWNWLGSAPQEIIRIDPTRIAQGIMTGIGFLGAGVIFKEGLTVRGLPTAASIWMTSSMISPVNPSICRLSADTMPLVSVALSPNGLPMAYTL